MMNPQARRQQRLEKLIASSSPEEANTACILYGQWLAARDSAWIYDPSQYRWQAAPPEGESCPGCYEWRRYPEGQRHFGWTWWRTCKHECQHPHHASEIWVG